MASELTNPGGEFLDLVVVRRLVLAPVILARTGVRLVDECPWHIVQDNENGHTGINPSIQSTTQQIHASGEPPSGVANSQVTPYIIFFPREIMIIARGACGLIVWRYAAQKTDCAESVHEGHRFVGPVWDVPFRQDGEVRIVDVPEVVVINHVCVGSHSGAPEAVKRLFH